MLAVGGIHYVALPWLILRVETAAIRSAGAAPRVRVRRGWPVAVGLAFMASGVGLAFAAAQALIDRGAGTPFPLDPTRHLVVDGPYRYVRNPQAIAACLIVAGEVLAVESRRLWLLLPLTVVYLEGLAAPLEHREMLGRFGQQYVQYRQRVPAWRIS
jgi:protein-S-isoprenylcysteine O-methyltransferase Ste14